MQIWTEDLFDDAVLYNPIGKLVAKHLDIRNAIGMNQFVVCRYLTLLHENSISAGEWLVSSVFKNTIIIRILTLRTMLMLPSFCIHHCHFVIS